jgi:hypothetical protein
MVESDANVLVKEERQLEAIFNSDSLSNLALVVACSC